MKIETNSAQENHVNIKFKSLRELQDKHLLAPVFVGMYVKDGGSFSHRSAGCIETEKVYANSLV